MEHLATKVRKLREIYGFSQESVAFEMGISQAAYSKKETGQTELSLNCLEKLANIYKLSIMEIISLSTQELLMLVIQKDTKATA
nr:helix-turn-helix transcriptional regulator [uncultured Emticicia sp.]